MDFGVVVMVLLLVLVMPVGVLLSMAVFAGVIGALIGRQSDLDNVTQDGEPNEYLELSESNPYVL
ncbi:MAG: hypothetical protein KTU85_10255 [Acidimicrobiia bacterium]|nr:hypothetical protein [Acidimicrobiia bacterium]